MDQVIKHGCLPYGQHFGWQSLPQQMRSECAECDRQKSGDPGDSRCERRAHCDEKITSDACAQVPAPARSGAMSSLQEQAHLPGEWIDWQPQQRAVLCFITAAGRVLLIHKKRGLGAGKINAPGGKIEPGESPLAAAVRETEEEIGVTPFDLQERGHLHFQFTDGFALHCTVFVATRFEGEPIETDEATPFWRAVDDIPYTEMWADDRHWLPQLLQGEFITGYFKFNDEVMLTKHVQFRAPVQLE